MTGKGFEPEEATCRARDELEKSQKLSDFISDYDFPDEVRQLFWTIVCSTFVLFVGVTVVWFSEVINDIHHMDEQDAQQLRIAGFPLYKQLVKVCCLHYWLTQ